MRSHRDQVQHASLLAVFVSPRLMCLLPCTAGMAGDFDFPAPRLCFRNTFPVDSQHAFCRSCTLQGHVGWCIAGACSHCSGRGCDHKMGTEQCHKGMLIVPCKACAGTGVYDPKHTTTAFSYGLTPAGRYALTGTVSRVN